MKTETMEEVKVHSTIERKELNAFCPPYVPKTKCLEGLKADELANEIWKAIIKPISVEKLTRDIMQLFNVSEKYLQPHVFAYLHELQNKNMIRVINTNYTAEQTEPLEHEREDKTLKEL